MPGAAELERVTADSYIWQVFDPKAKTDLFSTAIVTPHGTFIVDPVPLTEPALALLGQLGPIVGIIVTNCNHERASAEFAQRFSAPLFARRDSLSAETPSGFTAIGDGDRICEALDVVVIDGAAPGEIALSHPVSEGVLIVGDALINFYPHGFSFLPKKYCSNEKEMQRSLRKLLAHKSERMFFAHGTPILSQATARLRQLLDVDH
jgi:glyoxylase-like metal-dependent hydrolase (beta-lactamase superfamily II)